MPWRRMRRLVGRLIRSSSEGAPTRSFVFHTRTLSLSPSFVRSFVSVSVLH